MAKETRRPRVTRAQIGQYEIRKKGAVRFDLRDPYHLAVSMSWPEFLLCFAGLEIAINVVFALLYTLQPGAVANMATGTFVDAFFFSMETLATVGYGDMHPATLYGHTISAIEITAGVLFTAIMTGVMFVRFSRPRSDIRFADCMVVTRHLGRKTLMLRMANARLHLLSDAKAELFALISETTESGQTYRGTRELKLIRNRLPVFALTWTIMHVIDETSPLRDYDAARLLAEDVRFFVTTQARDPTLAATVHDTVSYGPDEIAFGMRYADAVLPDENGRLVAYLDRVSLIEAEVG